MTQVADPYFASFEAAAFHQETRYHWLICMAQAPDDLVSWGYASTQQLAEEAAQNELVILSSGLTKGGRVISKSAPPSPPQAKS
jgi:hypothetical protein